MDSEPAVRALAALDAWREQGRDRLDPVRFHLIEALARRAAAHSGETRRLLDARLIELVEAYTADLENSASEDAQRAVSALASSGTAPARSALAGLSSYATARHAPAAEQDNATTRHPAYPELDMLDYFREVSSKVRTQKQLRQSLAQVPGNAGPLNSSSLVHRSLSLMRELSPGYLRQFLSYVETLSWIEQINSSGASADKEAPRAAAGNESPKKRARGKAR